MAWWPGTSQLKHLKRHPNSQNYRMKSPVPRSQRAVQPSRDILPEGNQGPRNQQSSSVGAGLAFARQSGFLVGPSTFLHNSKNGTQIQPSANQHPLKFQSVWESLPSSSSEPSFSYELMIPAERRGQGIIKVGSSQHLIRILSMHSIFKDTHKSYLIITFHDSSPAKVQTQWWCFQFYSTTDGRTFHTWGGWNCL